MSDGRLVALDEVGQAWVAIGEPWGDDLIAFLGGGADAASLARHSMQDERRVTTAPPLGLPFKPASLRAFALWESHMINAARGMVDVFAPPTVKLVSRGFELLARRPFPPLRPKANYYRWPQFYLSSHRSVVADGETIAWPSFANVLDFELEIGVVLAREIRDCTPAHGLAAVGGFVVMNDWSARDTQWDDTRRGTFGGVVKAKTFAGAMSAVVVTADDILPRFDRLTGRVLVNGQEWASSSTAGPTHDLGSAIAYAAMGETLRPGDVLSTGTLPGCCGLELRRFPQPGDRVRLELDGIGTLTNTIGLRA